MKKAWAPKAGFTIVELLIVIVIIAILAAIAIIAYNGVQSRAKTSQIKSDISSVKRLIESYQAVNGSYPVTAANLNPNWGDQTAYADSGCNLDLDPGTKTVNWIPGVSTRLPQTKAAKGLGGYPGCYLYASDGKDYILSAWNMLDRPQTDLMYRRLGFREMDQAFRKPFYVCNLGAIGGDSGGYNINNDYYKYSITVSNITTCNETPPSGA
jgi:prepilin-type N-terminal cleavage/methylation domain-containing protein